MTPPTMTSAQRGSATARRARAAPSGSQPRPVKAPLTRVPRRISGPATCKHPGPRTHLPSRLAESALAFARGLPDHRLLDRLVRGRAWIPVLGVLLAGIVATQVEVLKLGASVGRWMERSAALTSRNQSLQASVSALSDDQRIERLAARMGMVMPAPTAITFLPSHSAGAVKISRIQAPDPSQFTASLAASVAAAETAVAPPGMAPVAPASPTAPAVGSTSTTTPVGGGATLQTGAATTQQTGG